MTVMATQISGVSPVSSGPRSKKTSKLRANGVCEGSPLVTDGFPSQKASDAEDVSIRWRHHTLFIRN